MKTRKMELREADLSGHEIIDRFLYSARVFVQLSDGAIFEEKKGKYYPIAFNRKEYNVLASKILTKGLPYEKKEKVLRTETGSSAGELRSNT